MRMDAEGNWYHDDCAEDLESSVKTDEADGVPPEGTTCALCDEPLVEVDEDVEDLSVEEKETLELPEA